MRRLRVAVAIGAVAGASLFSVGTTDARSKRCPRGKVRSHGKCVKKHSRQHQRQGY
jgi:hypothetical protein